VGANKIFNLDFVYRYSIEGRRKKNKENKDKRQLGKIATVRLG
jgi:hypothetical protein